MDIKQYIDYFDEISHLDRSKQFSVLEQAHQQVTEKYGFPILDIMPNLVRLMSVFIVTGGTYFFFGSSVWVLVVAAFLGLMIARVIVTETNDKLLLKAIKSQTLPD